MKNEGNEMSVQLRSLGALFFVFALLKSAPTFAQSEAQHSNLVEAIEQQKMARQFVEERKWTQARDAAALATQKAPNMPANRDAWLLLGASEERLGHLIEAKDAYSKYLDLSPAVEKRQPVAARVAELDAIVDHRLRYKWGSSSAGLAIGFSPLLQTQMKDEISSNLSSSYDFGFRIAQFSFGYKRAVGKSGAFLAPTSSKSNATYGLQPAGSSHVLEVFYLQYLLQLGENPEVKSVVWSIPFFMAGTSNGTRITSGKLYSTYGYDLATGLNVSLYTKSIFSVDVGALYHFGIPFGNPQSSEDALPIKNAKGEEITGSTTGAEVRIGVSILFGASVPEH